MIARRWSRVLLVAALAASLVANVFFFGYAVRGQQEFVGASPIAENVLTDYPAEVRSEFRRILRENRDRALAAVRELREARSAMAAAANASPFDEAALRSAMTRVRSRTDALQALIQDFLVDALKETQSAESIREREG